MRAGQIRTFAVLTAFALAPLSAARASQALLRPSDQPPKAADAKATGAKAEVKTASGAGGDEAKPKAGMVIEDSASAPEAPPPTPVGEEKAAIAELIRGQMKSVSHCYADAVDKKPTLQGKLYAVFYIGPSGRVIGATTQGLQDNDLSTCILSIVRKWEFEKPKSGGKLMVKYPFVFTPIGR